MLLKSLSRQSQIRIKKILVILTLTGLFFFIIVLIDNFFSIKNIEVNGLNNNQTLLGISSLNNTSLILLSEGLVAQKIKEENSFIKNITVKKIYPQKLTIQLELYEPKVVIVTNYGFFFLAEDGRILYKDTQVRSGLTLIRYYQKIDHYSYSVGDYLQFKDILTSLHFLKNILNYGLPVDSIDINGDNVIVFNLGEKKIIFSIEKTKDATDYELEQIIRQFKIEGKDFKSLDLRFDKPIIKF